MSSSSFPRAAGAACAAALTLLVSAPAHAAAESYDPLRRRLTGFVAASYDSARGGFVTRDRAPNESAIELAWLLARDGDPEWRHRARRGIEWTWTLFDSVGGGYLQSERDARHDVASFEKRTDANAFRVENRIDAWLDERARATAAEAADRAAIVRALDFFERVLLDGRGGFVAGQIGDRELVPAHNGPAIHAYLRWAAVTGEPKWRDFATLSLERVWTTSWNTEFGFLRRGTFGEVVSVPKLQDQVEMGRAFVLAAHLGGRAFDLQRARSIGDLLLTRFEDRKLGGMRLQVALAKDGRVKGAARDPEPNARAARFLAELASVSGEGKYRDAARRLVDVYVPGRNRAGVDDADWVLAMRAIEKAEFPDRPEWKVAPKPASASTTVKSGRGRR